MASNVLTVGDLFMKGQRNKGYPGLRTASGDTGEDRSSIFLKSLE